MKIAVLSGKGGAGKTFVAVGLGAVCGNCTYIDCDVEEPNGRIFFKPKNVEETQVSKELPQFDSEKCVGCRKCVEFCKFNALFYIKNVPMAFSDLCHGCGGCEIVCDKNAISRMKYPVGKVEIGYHNSVKVVTGELDTGEVASVEVIKTALKQAEGNTIIDCPPGSACSVLESVKGCDFCVLVCEPTAFSLHDVKMVHQLAVLLGVPCGMVVNKKVERFLPLEEFCRENAIEILGEIRYQTALARLISSGEIACEVSPKFRGDFENIMCKIMQKVGEKS